MKTPIIPQTPVDIMDMTINLIEMALEIQKQLQCNDLKAARVSAVTLAAEATGLYNVLCRLTDEEAAEAIIYYP
jgi:hypothetical protein